MAARHLRVKFAIFGAFPSLVCASLVLFLISYLADFDAQQVRSVLLCAALLASVLLAISIWFDKKWQSPLIELIESYERTHSLHPDQLRTLHERALRFPIYTYVFNLSWWLVGTLIGSVLFVLTQIKGLVIIYILMSGCAGGLLSALIQFYTVKAFLWRSVNPILARTVWPNTPRLTVPLTVRSKLLISFASVIVPSLIISLLLADSTVLKQIKREYLEHQQRLVNHMVSEIAPYELHSWQMQPFTDILERYEAMGLSCPISVFDRAGQKLFGGNPIALLGPEQRADLVKVTEETVVKASDGATILCVPMGTTGKVVIATCHMERLSAHSSHLRRVFVLSSLLLLVALILIAYQSSHDIARPIDSLKAQAQLIAQGAFETTTEVFSDDEIGELSWHLMQMTKTLKESSQILETKVKERTQELERVNRELKTLNKLKDEFLSSVSHELRTPLTSIRSFSEILLRYPDEAEHTKKEFLEIIHTESQRLTRLINELLDLAKIESGKMSWHDQILDVQQVLTDVLSTLRIIVDSKGLALHVNVSPHLPHVFMDRDRLVQVFTNLISNAVKFTEPGGSIHISVEPIIGKRIKDVVLLIKVCVADTGIGIHEKDHNVIFEKFVQVDPLSGEKPRGTGLGLAICKKIISHYGGDIWVESTPGKGSKFCFTIPCAPPAQSQSEEE